MNKTPWYVWALFLIVPFFCSPWLFRPERREAELWFRYVSVFAFGAGFALASPRFKSVWEKVTGGILFGFVVLGVLMVAVIILSLIIRPCPFY
jgi:hypothetical protein